MYYNIYFQNILLIFQLAAHHETKNYQVFTDMHLCKIPFCYNIVTWGVSILKTSTGVIRTNTYCWCVLIPFIRMTSYYWDVAISLFVRTNTYWGNFRGRKLS